MRRRKMDKEKKEGKMVWVQDKEGNVFVCKLADLIDPKKLSAEDKEKCLDTTDYDISGAV
jgi:hypothetical protein